MDGILLFTSLSIFIAHSRTCQQHKQHANDQKKKLIRIVVMNTSNSNTFIDEQNMLSFTHFVFF